VPPSLLSIEDFPALMPSSFEPPVDLNATNTSRETPIPVIKAREKAERKVVKKATLVQKVVEKEKMAQSKAEAKMAVEMKVARGQTPEKNPAVEGINPVSESASTAKQMIPTMRNSQRPNCWLEVFGTKKHWSAWHR
jgi:hypothetical protein